MLPVIVPAAEGEAVFGPDDLGAGLEPEASRDCWTSLVERPACQS